MKALHFLLLSLIAAQFSFAQEVEKQKEVRYELTVRGIEYKGTYIGETGKGIVNGKKKKGPSGQGIFRGVNESNPDFSVWLIYSGSWSNGRFEGTGSFSTFSLPKNSVPMW